MTLPYGKQSDNAMLWQAESRMYFRMCGGLYGHDPFGVFAVAGAAGPERGSYLPDQGTSSLTLPNGVGVTYGYDSDSRVNNISYSANSNSLGNLTYTFDPDRYTVGEGGSLAAVNLPVAVTNTYDTTNQIATWGGHSGHQGQR